MIPDIRGVGKSEGDITFDRGKDGYDLIEWIAEQPWCNGNVGMIGMSAFAMAQYTIAGENPPHLKAVFPFEGVTDYYRHFYYHYEIDKSKSRPYAPYHPHARSLSIKPGEVILYASDLRMTSNVFLEGHRIRLEISGQDQVQALWYHLPHMARVKHTIYNSGDRPSYVLLPIIPKGYKGAGKPEFPPAGPFRIPKYKRKG